MNRFAWINAKSIAEAATATSTTVASAMTMPPEAIDQGEAAVVKANGIDLLDLLKEGLLKPSKVVSLIGVRGLDQVVEEEAGGLRIGPMVTLAALADHSLVQERYPALADALRGSASPQIRNVATIGGNLLQRPRCWYFRSRAYRCLRKGGGHCFAISGENQYHAIFNNMPCAIVHPSTAATVLVALSAKVELTSASSAVRELALEDFFLPPERDLQRENDLQPQEILTAIRLPKLAANACMAPLVPDPRISHSSPMSSCHTSG